MKVPIKDLIKTLSSVPPPDAKTGDTILLRVLELPRANVWGGGADDILGMYRDIILTAAVRSGTGELEWLINIR